MPIANAKDGCPINYEVEGPASAPVLMMCNSLGTNLHMWDDQAAAGVVEAVPPGALRPPRPRQIGRAQGALYDGHAGRRRARRSPTPPAQKSSTGAGSRWAAWSANGWAANARRPRRKARSLQHALPLRRQAGLARPHQVRPRQRPGQASGPQMERWFTKGFRDSSPEAVGKVVEMFAATKLDSFVGCCEGGARHGLPRLDADHHRAGRGHRRRQGPGDAAGVRPGDPQDDQGLQDRFARGPPISPTSSSPRPTPTRC